MASRRGSDAPAPFDPPPVPRYEHGSRVPGWDDAVDLSKDPAEIPDLATTPVPAGLRAQIEGHMAKYPDRRSAILPALKAAQREHGWCSPEAVEQAAAVLRLTPAELSANATFYDMLDTEPRGRQYVYVCTNISCSMRGADAVLEAIEAAAGGDAAINVRAFECLGACDLAPMASVDGAYVGPLAPGDAERLLDDLRAGREPLPEKQLSRRGAPLDRDSRADPVPPEEHPAPPEED
jgi:NADH-quinone oxidoreductase subunit E